MQNGELDLRGVKNVSKHNYKSKSKCDVFDYSKIIESRRNPNNQSIINNSLGYQTDRTDRNYFISQNQDNNQNNNQNQNQYNNQYDKSKEDKLINKFLNKRNNTEKFKIQISSIKKLNDNNDNTSLSPDKSNNKNILLQDNYYDNNNNNNNNNKNISVLNIKINNNIIKCFYSPNFKRKANNNNNEDSITLNPNYKIPYPSKVPNDPKLLDLLVKRRKKFDQYLENKEKNKETSLAEFHKKYYYVKHPRQDKKQYVPIQKINKTNENNNEEEEDNENNNEYKNEYNESNENMNMNNENIESRNSNEIVVDNEDERNLENIVETDKNEENEMEDNVENNHNNHNNYESKCKLIYLL